VIALKAEHRLKVLLDVAALAHLLKRQFDAAAPNQKWVTGVTEFSVGDRQLYQSPIMDLFDRQIISYAIGPAQLEAGQCLAAGRLGPRWRTGRNLSCTPTRNSNIRTTPGAHSWRTSARSN
jgi:transposase InsO family protein